MEAYIGRKKFSIYAYDLESHNDEESIAKQETSIWLSCFINEKSKISDEDSYLYTIEDFIQKLEYLSSPKRKHGKKRAIKNIAVFIYNLSFEWSFILPKLLERGFTFKEHIEDDDEFVFNSVSTRSVSSVWLAQIKFGKKSGIVAFKDLSKIFGGGLGKVAQAFNLPTQKGSIDYRKNRLHDYVVTPEEKEYCFKDTRIIIDILLAMKEKNDKLFWKSASMASYAMNKLLARAYPTKVKPYAEYRKEYPELDEEETKFLREGVSGGITYAPSRYQFKDIQKTIAHIDAHSMHPSQAFRYRFPYGKGKHFTGEPSHNQSTIKACRIRVTYDDVRLHSIIKLIGTSYATDYELVVWDFEIPTMKKCYVNLDIEYIDGYEYQTKPLPWRRFYSDCYYKRLEAKAKGDSFNNLFNKLLINSSYGKHLEKPHNEIFENTINSLGIITSLIYDKPVEKQQINAKYTYLPVGSAIPARSRVCLIEKALLLGWEKICYFDTDSIFFVWDEETKKVWEDNKCFDKRDFLGGWAMEAFIERAQFIAPKRYKQVINGKTDIKAGGINFNKYIEDKSKEKGINPEDYKIEYGELNLTNCNLEVQRAYRVKGGTIIEFQKKEIRIPKKYEEIYRRNIEENGEDTLKDIDAII